MKLRFLSSLLMFISAYFPLALIFIIKDLNEKTACPQHPYISATIAIIALISCIVVLVAARTIDTGLPVRILKVTNKSGDMFTYTIPYMISFYNFNLGDWKTLLCLFVFMGLMFALSYRTQSMFINPVLAIAGYGLYDCQFKDGNREAQGLLLSDQEFKVGSVCIIERISSFLYFVVNIQSEETLNDR